jgi:uncharacterized protein
MTLPLVPPRLHQGGHLQTILAAKLSAVPYPCPLWQRERWEWADEGQGSDFCDADWLHPVPQSVPLNLPILVLFHGLEGNSQSHYAKSIGAYFQAQGWRVVVPHFRGCGGEPNRLLRAYHSGDAPEIARMLAKVHQAYPLAPLYAVGVSLGGNALLCYLADKAAQAPVYLQRAASVCAPLDLARCENALNQGFAKVYTHSFLRTLRLKALEKSRRFPTGCDWSHVLAAKNLAQFDEAFTAPVHGYRNAQDYYARASAKFKLRTIQVPTLVLNTGNDPFVPPDILQDLKQYQGTAPICLEQTEFGGHVGFATQGGRFGLGCLNWLPQRLYHWLVVDNIQRVRQKLDNNYRA